MIDYDENIDEYPLPEWWDESLMGDEVEVEEEDNLEKAGKKDISKLKKIKRLVTRDGKTFLTTYYVKTGEHYVEDTDKHKVMNGELPENIAIGDLIEVETVRKDKEVGIVGGFSYNRKLETFFIRLLIEGEDDSYINVKNIVSLKKSKEEIKEEERKIDSIKDKNLYKVESLGGSSGVELKVDGDANKYAVKKPHKGDLDQLRQEAVINKLYRELGFNAPESIIDEDAEVMISKFIVGNELGKIKLTDKLKEEIQKGYVLDALLANWDVIGANKDNILVDGNKVYRIDNGGCMATRARGGVKEYSSFNIPEIKTLKEHNKEIYGDVTDEQIKEQVKDLFSKKDTIDKVLSKLPNKTLKDTFNSRLIHLAEIIGVKLDEEKEPTLPKKEKVLRGGMPSLVTQDYFDEKWDKVNIGGNPGLKEKIKENIFKTEKYYAIQYLDMANSLGVTVEQLKADMQRMVEGIVARSTGYIVAHSSGGYKGKAVTGMVLSEGRFKSQFETGDSLGAYSPHSRASTEYEFFGFERDVGISKEQRPIYGFFTDIDHGAINDKKTVPPPRQVSQYGDVCFEVKDEKFRKDATITFNDSLSMYNQMAATPASAPHFTSVVPGMSQYRGLKKLFESGVTEGTNAGYVETQYHGQLKIEDIEKVHVSIKEYSPKKLTNTINEINNATLKGGKIVPIELF